MFLPKWIVNLTTSGLYCCLNTLAFFISNKNCHRTQHRTKERQTWSCEIDDPLWEKHVEDLDRRLKRLLEKNNGRTRKHNGFFLHVVRECWWSMRLVVRRESLMGVYRTVVFFWRLIVVGSGLDCSVWRILSWLPSAWEIDCECCRRKPFLVHAARSVIWRCHDGKWCMRIDECQPLFKKKYGQVALDCVWNWSCLIQHTKCLSQLV